MGAALAFYSAFSLAPLLLIVMAVAGLVYGADTARKAVVKSLKFTEPKMAIHGATAIARHFYESESEEAGKTTKIKIGVLQVWQKTDGKWKLYARQAHILPA